MFAILGLLQLLTVKSVLADYCEFGLCDDETQYCCGKNKCCENMIDLWFFWGIVLIVVFIVALFTFCNKWGKGQYVRVNSQDPENESH